jgi:hypothetical protein
MKRAILAMALLLPLPAYSEAIDIDRSRSVGPTVSIITPSGINCSETAGDRPSIWMGGRIRDQINANQTANPNQLGNGDTTSTTYINSNLFNEEAGWSVGAGIHIPFGGPPTGNCRRFVAIAEREHRLAMLGQMLANKAITLAQYTELSMQLYEHKEEGN